MFTRRALRACAVACLVTTGCTSLREIPTSEYTAQANRKDLRLVTKDGLEYQFDYAQVTGDTLVGYRRRDVEGPFDDFAVLHLPLSDVSQMEARKVDWTRTSLVGGGIIAVGLAIGFAVKNATSNGSESSGGAKGGGGIPAPQR